MSLRTKTYGPPESDSESDYDGFYFGDDPIEKTKMPLREVDPDHELHEAVQCGNLEVVQQEVTKLQIQINEPIKGGFTLLLHACTEGHYDIVKYLVEEKLANVNKQIDSYTPLMMACNCTKDSDVVANIVLLLLKYGAVVNVSDKYGTTPFMLACKNGHTAAVRHMIKDVSFDAIDNQGCTPLFHAVENNHAEIVKILVDAGADTRSENMKGYNIRQVAQFHGFYDLLELLPKEKKTYMLSTKLLSYNTLRDYIPRIFLKSDCPEYFQEINLILLSLDMDSFLEYFAKAHCTLEQFLTLNDEAIKTIGIKYPLHRMKLQKGLLDFHLHHWAKNSIARVTKQPEDDFYNILMITANQLQQLVIIKATLSYISNNIRAGRLGYISILHMDGMRSKLKAYGDIIKDLIKTTQYLASFSPRQNPLYIDYDEYLAARNRSKIKRYVKYTTVILGFSVFVCLKFKNFL